MTDLKDFVIIGRGGWHSDTLNRLLQNPDFEVNIIDRNTSGFVAIAYNTSEAEIKRAMLPFGGGVIKQI